MKPWYVSRHLELALFSAVLLGVSLIAVACDDDVKDEDTHVDDVAETRPDDVLDSGSEMETLDPDTSEPDVEIDHPDEEIDTLDIESDGTCHQPSYSEDCREVGHFQCGFMAVCQDGALRADWHEHTMCNDVEDIVSFTCTFSCPHGCVEGEIIDWPEDGPTLIERYCLPGEIPSDQTVTIEVVNNTDVDKFLLSAGHFCQEYSIAQDVDLPLQLGFQCGCECPPPFPDQPSEFVRLSPGGTHSMTWDARSLWLYTQLRECGGDWETEELQGVPQPVGAGVYEVSIGYEDVVPDNCQNFEGDVFTCNIMGSPGTSPPEIQRLCETGGTASRTFALPETGDIVVTLELGDTCPLPAAPDGQVTTPVITTSPNTYLDQEVTVVGTLTSYPNPSCDDLGPCGTCTPALTLDGVISLRGSEGNAHALCGRQMECQELQDSCLPFWDCWPNEIGRRVRVKGTFRQVSQAIPERFWYRIIEPYRLDVTEISPIDSVSSSGLFSGTIQVNSIQGADCGVFPNSAPIYLVVAHSMEGMLVEFMEMGGAQAQTPVLGGWHTGMMNPEDPGFTVASPMGLGEFSGQLDASHIEGTYQFSLSGRQCSVTSTISADQLY